MPQASPTAAALRSPTSHRSPQQFQTRPSQAKRAPVITAASAVINDLLPASEREVAREKEKKRMDAKNWEVV